MAAAAVPMKRRNEKVAAEPSPSDSRLLIIIGLSGVLSVAFWGLLGWEAYRTIRQIWP